MAEVGRSVIHSAISNACERASRKWLILWQFPPLRLGLTWLNWLIFYYVVLYYMI